MNWDYFRDPKTGKFRLKRLPPIKSPIPVKDVTEVNDYRGDYEHLAFDEALKQYQARFDAYDIEIDDPDSVFESAPAKYLGGLSAFRQDTGLFWSLMEMEDPSDDSQALKTSPIIAEKLAGLVRIVRPADGAGVRAILGKYTAAELKEACSSLGLKVGGKKGDLIQRLSEHEDANPGAVPMPTLVMPMPALKERYRECYIGMIEALVDQLADYPERYRRAVLEELALDFEDEHFSIRDIIARTAGIEIQKPVPAPRKTKEEWGAERAASDAERERSQEAPRTADTSWPTSYKVAAVVVAVLVIWALL